MSLSMPSMQAPPMITPLSCSFPEQNDPNAIAAATQAKSKSQHAAQAAVTKLTELFDHYKGAPHCTARSFVHLIFARPGQ